MKICLIRPPILVPAKNVLVTYSPPVGLAYVASALRNANFEICFIDGLGESVETRYPWGTDSFNYGLTFEQILEKIPDDAGMIGVHAGFSFDWPMCRELINLIRQHFPRVTLIGGGEHLTAAPAESLIESALDLIVCGEGEETAVEVAKSVENGNKNFESINGVALLTKEGKFIKTDPRARLTDIDKIAPPAWDTFPINNYLDRGFGLGVDRGRSMPIVASRGCPYQCTFCSSPNMWTTRWVIRDPDLLLDEIEDLINRFGATNFDFYDLTFVLKKQWIVDFCQKIEERGLKFTWQIPSGSRTEAIDREVAYWMFRSGCRNLTYAPESGSPSVLKEIKKKVNPESMVNSVRGSVKEGLNIKIAIIFGFPNDTLMKVFESYKFIAKLALAGAHDLSIWGYAPYPGSELFDNLVAKNHIKLDDDFYDKLRTYGDPLKTTSYCENFSNNGLKALRFIGHGIFYSISYLARPIRPYRIIQNLIQGNQESRMEMALSDAFRRVKFYLASANSK
jgi:anaerobic magnesium-protoporphyrin IX monomethyl ester cyclase